MRPVILIVLAALLSGCATIIDGTTQNVAIRTAPTGATCLVQRGGNVLGTIPSSPGSLLVERSKEDLTVLCRKTGWQPALAGIESKWTGVMFGNALVGGVPGVVVDAFTGAGFLYDDGKIILMSPERPDDRLSGLSDPAASSSAMAPSSGSKVPATGFILSQAH